MPNKKQEPLTKRQKLKLKAKTSALKFKRELKKSAVTAIIAAFGFLIALTWRDVIVEYINKLDSINPLQGKLISAIIITIISVLGILIITSLFSHEKSK